MSASQPYRAPPPIEPDPEAQLRAEAERVGPLRSVHASSSLRAALLGPVIIAAAIEGVGLAIGGPALVVTPFALVALALLSLPAWRTRNLHVELHEAGVVAVNASGRDVVAFGEVDAVWFKLDAFQKRYTAIRAISLTDHGGGRHEIPLEVSGAPALAGAIVKECSTPLLAEAHRALKDGERLVFGDVTLEGDSIRIGATRARWREIRLAVAERGSIALYRTNPVFVWRRIRLDRVPHPTVFMALVKACAPKMRVDDVILIPYATGSERNAALVAQGSSANIQRMLIGGVLFLGSVTTILFTLAANSNYFVFAFGPMIGGGVLFARGLVAYLSQER